MDTYKTTDFRMAGYLSARGVSLVGTEVNYKKEVVFWFPMTPETQNLAATFQGSPEQRYDVACKMMHTLVRSVLQTQK